MGLLEGSSRAARRGGGLVFAPLCLLLLLLTGCTAVAVVDTAASVTVRAVGTAAKAGVAVIDAVVPDGDDEEEDE